MHIAVLFIAFLATAQCGVIVLRTANSSISCELELQGGFTRGTETNDFIQADGMVLNPTLHTWNISFSFFLLIMQSVQFAPADCIQLFFRGEFFSVSIGIDKRTFALDSREAIETIKKSVMISKFITAELLDELLELYGEEVEEFLLPLSFQEFHSLSDVNEIRFLEGFLFDAEALDLLMYAEIVEEFKSKYARVLKEMGKRLKFLSKTELLNFYKIYCKAEFNRLSARESNSLNGQLFLHSFLAEAEALELPADEFHAIFKAELLKVKKANFWSWPKWPSWK